MATVIRPALARGAVVVTDRYMDSSVAYQGAGRDLDIADIARISRWATDGLRPDLTVLLDLPPELALPRVQAPDRLESEPLDFHERVRQHFLTLARSDSSSYLVVDAMLAPEQMAAQVQDRLTPMLPLSPREVAEQKAAEESRRAEEEERQRQEAAAAAAAQEQARREAEERARREAEDLAARKAAEAEARDRREAEEQARRAAEAAETEARKNAEAQARQQAAEAAEAARRRQQATSGAADTQRLDRQPAPAPSDADRADPPTRQLSLTDELLGGDSVDETIQLPVHKSRDDR